MARSTFPSQNVQDTPFSDHFWKLICRKSARGCGAKHISKSKCTKHNNVGPLLEAAMSKKCTPLWREAHFEVKILKTPFSDNFWTLRCRSAWQVQGIVDLVKSEQNVRVLWHFQLQPPLYTTLHSNTLQLQLHLHYIPLHSTPLHYTALNYTQIHTVTPTLHYTTLHSTTFHYTTLHYTTLHYTE